MASSRKPPKPYLHSGPVSFPGTTDGNQLAQQLGRLQEKLHEMDKEITDLKAAVRHAKWVLGIILTVGSVCAALYKALHGSG